MLTVAGARRMVRALPGFAALATANGTEVQGLGYRRLPVGPWQSDDGRMFTAPAVQFGPANGSWSPARSVVLVDGDGWAPIEVAEIEPFIALDGATLKVLPLLNVRR